MRPTGSARSCPRGRGRCPFRHPAEWSGSPSPRVSISSFTARAPKDGIVALTLSLVNTLTADPGEKDAGACWLRSEELRCDPIGTALRERPPATVAGIDEDEIASQQLLFRDVRSYAVGHGCAATWAGDPIPRRWSTTFLPRHELLLSEAAGGDGLDLSMNALAGDETFEVLDQPESRPVRGMDRAASTGHRRWGLDDDEVTPSCVRHAAEARAGSPSVCAAGIHPPARGTQDVRHAFHMTNRAMAEQRSRQEFHRKGGRGNPPVVSRDSGWRALPDRVHPHQPAGPADAAAPGSRVADLIWFPTGGGKTEAYLGLIAFSSSCGACATRRRRRDGADALHAAAAHAPAVPARDGADLRARAPAPEREAPGRHPSRSGCGWGRRRRDRRRHVRRALKRRQDQRRGTSATSSRPCAAASSARGAATALDRRDYEIVDRSGCVSPARGLCAFSPGLPVHLVRSTGCLREPTLARDRHGGQVRDAAVEA